MKTVIITGVTGQDGSYMVDYLLKKDVMIYGVVRRTSTPNLSNLPEQSDRFKIVTADLSDSSSIDYIVRTLKPDYFINFGAQSFVGSSWSIPEQTFDVDAVGVIRCLEAIRKHAPDCRFYNAGSSEEFGDVQYSPQNIAHPSRARSPYGAAKIAARQIVKVYRESYGLFAVQGLLFNHESERRGEEFVTRKITKGVARIFNEIKNGQTVTPIRLGNIDAIRDWSHACDFVDGVWRMLNQNHPTEYLLASGEGHTVREFVEKAFEYADFFRSRWVGTGVNEKYLAGGLTIDDSTNHRWESGIVEPTVLVEIDPTFYRPAEVALLIGDSSPAKEDLGWKPQIGFEELVRRMVQNDLTKASK